MALNRLVTNPPKDDNGSLLSPVNYDDDAASLHSRSDQDTDTDDDELQSRARNSRELRAADRIVLMEEDELDRLVIDSRRRQERDRRGSGLSVPNALKIFRKPSLSQLSSASASTENLAGPGTGNGIEKKQRRSARRNRRRQKRERLREDAIHGEDGELMYEMEEGGMKDGSSTGDSSDRDDSEEADRRHLNLITQNRGRSWRRWIFIHLLIVIAFAILVLVAWKLSKNRKSRPPASALVSNGTALFAPTTIIISLDGFRADFLQRDLTPRLNAFVKEGVSPPYMMPSFPSLTFPNHYTLATGLYPEAHGIVGNTFWDPETQQEFYYTDPARSLDGKWWNAGEPFWVTAQRQGVRAAVHMWPGSEAPIHETFASIVDKYNGNEPLENKVSRVLGFLDMPGMEDASIASNHDARPQVIAAYVPNVDTDGHKYGPNSTEIRTTIQNADGLLDALFAGLEQRNLTHIVNVIVVSDHGMATTDTSRLVQLEDLIDTSKLEHIDGWPLYGLRPKSDDDIRPLYEQLRAQAESNPNFEVYLRDENMPERYHFSNNPRIAPLWIVPATGWAIVTKDEFDVQDAKKKGLVYHPRGLHGYDHEHPLMRAIFIARGPAFPHPANSRLEPFQNYQVYNMLCDSVGIEPAPNNGTLRLPLKPVGSHDEVQPEQPDDPPTTIHPERPTKPTAAPAAPAAPANEEQEVPPHPTPQVPPHHEDEESRPDGVVGLVKGTISGIWGWVTDKVGGLWDDIKKLGGN